MLMILLPQNYNYLVFSMAMFKSSLDTGASSSDRLSCRISSGLLPAILRRIVIIAASLEISIRKILKQVLIPIYKKIFDIISKTYFLTVSFKLNVFSISNLILLKCSSSNEVQVSVHNNTQTRNNNL